MNVKQGNKTKRLRRVRNIAKLKYLFIQKDVCFFDRNTTTPWTPKT